MSVGLLLSPVLFCGILLLLRFPGLISQARLGSGTRCSRLFLSFSFPGSLSLTLSLLFSFSLCFFDFFLDLLLKDERLLSRSPSRTECPGDDVLKLGTVSAVDMVAATEGGHSATTVSWESQSLPLWLESLLTSDSASKGRGMSSTGSCWELEVTPPSAMETTSACAPPASPFPLEELIFPLTGAGVALLARWDILGFLLASGSVKSAAGRFWQRKKSYFRGRTWIWVQYEFSSP